MANPSIISMTKNSFSALSETPSPPCHSFTNISAVSNHHAGHQNLWNAGIIHRDDNILIGNPDVAEGNRGLIIFWSTEKVALQASTSGWRVNFITEFSHSDFETGHLWVSIPYGDPKSIIAARLHTPCPRLS